MLHPPRKLRPDDPLASQINPLIDAVSSGLDISAAPPLNVDKTPAGVHLWGDFEFAEIVLIRSDTPNANGYYDGVIQRWNPEGGTWVDIEDVWVKDANG